jgi:membrane protein implicated in regulation of membrane protease activity
MTWENIYLVCFLVGFLLSLLSFLGGSRLHLPKGLHVHVGHVGHGGGGHGAGRGAQTSPFNFATLTAFLTWFGAAGYLLTKYSTIWAVLALGLAFLTGLGGAAAVFWFLVKFLLKHDYQLDPADYDMIGMLGRISSPVREGGTGEMIFSQNGVRRAASVRSDTGEALGKDSEVVVTRYEKGIAYVRSWDELSDTKTATSMGR